MTGKFVVALGLDPSDLAAVRAIAREFDWVVLASEACSGLDRFTSLPGTVALLCTRRALGRAMSWLSLVREMKQMAPHLRLILCHGFADLPDWPEASRAGAFHALAMPLNEGELRQSLGFVLEAESRIEAQSQPRKKPLARGMPDNAPAVSTLARLAAH